jgi:crotonobetainyl-CoA:carnitine CoA-transferase CaiB-like acyl-CoA transferase
MALLNGTRVLDFTNQKGLLAGRMLADLGADVVQVEPSSGSRGRGEEPLTSSGESSYYWATYAANKRGISEDFNDPAAIARLRRLMVHADVLIESERPGTMAQFGLDYETARQINPRLVYVSVTAFGSTGPKSDYQDSDLTVWAAGGPLEPHRDAGRVPVRISIHQAYLHAAADAANGALFALLARHKTGRGQHVDVSAQASLGTATLGRVLASAVGDDNPDWEQVADVAPKHVDQSGSGAGTDPARKKWPCADGMIELHVTVGPAAGAFTTAFFRWMLGEGADVERFANTDWRAVPRMLAEGTFTDADVERAREAIGKFLLTKTKTEVLAAARDQRLVCVPIYDTTDLRLSEQLQSRRFFTTVAGDDGRTTLLANGFAAVPGMDAFSVRRAAPALGEHTTEVYDEWLVPAGVSR